MSLSAIGYREGKAASMYIKAKGHPLITKSQKLQVEVSHCLPLHPLREVLFDQFPCTPQKRGDEFHKINS